MDALHSEVNGNKPSKPKDLGWDYQKDKEAKRVFERKKELQKLREKEKERKSKQCPECRYTKHLGPCSCKLCGKKGHEFKDCPKLRSPKEVPEPTIEFCIECMVPHPPGRCICLTSLTHAKCGTRSTLCWKVGNISGSTELFAL